MHALGYTRLREGASVRASEVPDSDTAIIVNGIEHVSSALDIGL
jgi:hypothetical protein